MSDILERVRLNSGLRFEIVRIRSVHKAMQLLDSVTVELAILLDTDYQGSKYLFTRPVISTPYTIITKSESTEELHLDDDSPHDIALPQSDALLEYIQQQYPHLKTHTTDNKARP